MSWFLSLMLLICTASITFGAEPRTRFDDTELSPSIAPPQPPPAIPMVDKKRWKLYHRSALVSFYYDVKSVHRIKDTVSFWTMGIDKNDVTRSKFVTEIKCFESKYRTPLLKTYGPSGEGLSFDDYSSDDLKCPWSYIEPESATDKMKEKLCRQDKSQREVRRGQPLARDKGDNRK